MPMLRRWAREYLRMLQGGFMARNHDGGCGWHQDGMPLSSIASIASHSERGPTTDAGTQRRFAEVWSRSSLAVRRSMEGMPAPLRDTLIAAYLCRGSHRERAAALGISKASYWRRLGQAHAYVAGRIELMDGNPAQIG